MNEYKNAEPVAGMKAEKQPSADKEGLVFEIHEEKNIGENGPAPAKTEKLDRAAAKDNVPIESSLDGNIPPARDSASPAEKPADAASVEAPQSSPASKIWYTYTPRFTEVSDQYRMRGDKRRREKLPGMKASEEEKDKNAVESDIDPTAEIEADPEKIPTIHIERKEAEEKVERLNVYKFSGEEDYVDEINGVTADDEAKKIEELLAREPSTPPRIVVDLTPEENVSPEEESAQLESEPEPIEEKVAPELPDPDNDGIRVFDYGKVVEEPEDGPDGMDEPSVFAVDGKGRAMESEFTNPAQRDGIKDRFLDSLMSIRIRFGTALLFAIALLVVEILSVSGVISYSVLPNAKVNFTLSLVDYVLATGIFVLSLPEIVRSTRYLLRKKFLPDMLSLFGFIVFSAYTVAVVLTDAPEYPLFGFLFALMSICSIKASKHRMSADFLGFKVISRNEEKQILDKKPTRDLTMENHALDGVVDEYSSRIVRTFRTTFISDFFRNSGDVSGVPSATLLVLLSTLGVGAAAALVIYLVKGDVLSAIGALTISVLVGTPVFSILSSKLSFHQSQRAAVLEESCAVGEGAFYNFASTDVVAFEDTDIFGPEDVNLKRFMLYGERGNMENVMRQMCALFAVTGGPLDFMFSNAIDNRMRHKSATNTVIEDDGLSGEVGGKRIFAGSQEYMIRNGIAIPEAAKTTDVSLDTTKVLYAAEDGEVCAKFYIRYSFSEEFTSILPALKEHGIIPLIYTRDPNVTNELLDTLTAGADCMRVVKVYKPIPAEEKIYPRVSARMVTYGDKLNTISMLLLSRKYKKFSERISFIEKCATAVGLMLAVMLCVFGLNSASVIVSVIWQIVLCAVLQYMSYNTFLKEHRRKNDED